MIKAFNIQEIEKKGGIICGNDDFEIMQCSKCGGLYLYNHEILTLSG